MADLLRFAPADSTVLLCRIFRETVLCVHQVTGADRPAPVSYERGRPMPLFRGGDIEDHPGPSCVTGPAPGL